MGLCTTETAPLSDRPGVGVPGPGLGAAWSEARAGEPEPMAVEPEAGAGEPEAMGVGPEARSARSGTGAAGTPERGSTRSNRGPSWPTLNSL
jgi:hypothetical protein